MTSRPVRHVLRQRLTWRNPVQVCEAPDTVVVDVLEGGRGGGAGHVEHGRTLVHRTVERRAEPEAGGRGRSGQVRLSHVGEVMRGPRHLEWQTTWLTARVQIALPRSRLMMAL